MSRSALLLEDPPREALRGQQAETAWKDRGREQRKHDPERHHPQHRGGTIASSALNAAFTTTVVLSACREAAVDDRS